MPAGSEAMKAAIEPGSTEYGQRQTLEAGLAGLGAGAGGAAAPPGSGGAPFQVPESPLGALLGGEVGGGNQPLTDGLSVGPGIGPALDQDPLLSDRAHRLRLIATQAVSPQLRALARSELRRLTREPV